MAGADQSTAPVHEELPKATLSSFLRIYGYEIGSFKRAKDGTISAKLVVASAVEMDVELTDHVYEFTPGGYPAP